MRVVLVLLLLGLAVHGLSSRRNLDWAEIADAPGSTWAGIVLFGLAGFVVVLSVRTLIRLLRGAPGEDDDEDGPDVEPKKMSPWTYVAAVALFAVTVLLVYLLLRSATQIPAHYRGQRIGRPGTPQAPDAVRPHRLDHRAALLALVAGAALALAFVLGVVRRRADIEPEPDDGEPGGDTEDGTALAEAVAAAEEQLDSHGDDTRAAIIAAYLAMERALVSTGASRRASDTPTDFIVRAMNAAHVPLGAATRLTDLFREARFSTHPMPPGARDDAVRALAGVSAALTRSHG